MSFVEHNSLGFALHLMSHKCATNHIKGKMKWILPAFQDTLVQISKKQLPYDQNQHHNPACKYKAFSKHTSSSHMVSIPVRRT